MMRLVDWVKFVALSALWGGSFLFMRVAVPVIGPVFNTSCRIIFATLGLLVYALLIRTRMDLVTKWREFIVIALLNNVMPYLLISSAELKLSASNGAILNSTVPLWGAIIAAFWLKQELTPTKIIGLVVAFSGVVLLVGWNSSSVTLPIILSMMAVLVATVMYAIAGVYAKIYMVGVPPLTTATGGLAYSALIILPLAPFSVPHVMPSATVIICILSLALLSTSFAFVLFYQLIHDVGPTQAVSSTFIVPIFGMIWGAIFLAEQITVVKIISCTVIVLGAWLVTKVPTPRPQLAD